MKVVMDWQGILQFVPLTYPLVVDRITVISPNVLFTQSCFARTESRFAWSMKLFCPHRESTLTTYVCGLLF